MTVAPCRDLIVYSSHPESGVQITVSPLDQNAMGGDATPFARVYCTGTQITLQAPATFGGNNFFKWLRDSADYSTDPSITINFDTSRTMTAVYFVPVLTVEAVNAPRPVLIGVSPADLDGQEGEFAPYVRTYTPGTEVTLTAPASSFGNPFLNWRRNGVDYPGGASVTLTMDSSYTMSAVYHLLARVEVESKTVASGPNLVPVHIKLTNDVPLRSIVLPLEIRAVTPGARISKFRVGYTERLASYLTGTILGSQYADANGNCKVWLTNGYGTMTSLITPNTELPVAALPEGILLIRGRTTDPALPPGSDTLGSIVLSLGVVGSGSFEIDTTCMNPSSHILLTQENPPAYTSAVPVFSKGMITVTSSGCSCPGQGDVDDDMVIDVFDVIYHIDVAFQGYPDISDEQCPISRTDANSDGVTDVFDVIYIIANAFSNGPDPLNPCGM